MEREDPGQEPEENAGQDSESIDTPETSEPKTPETQEARLETPDPKTRKDPTEGMTAEQQVDYWKKRYGGAQQDISRLKQQRASGGLSKTIPSTPRDDTGTNGAVKPLDQIESLGEFLDHARHHIKKEVFSELSQQQMEQRAWSAEQAARKAHDGSDGLPTYDEIFDEYVQPLINVNANLARDLVTHYADPAEASYMFGILQKCKTMKGVKDLFASEARDDLVKNINKAGKQAGNIKGRGSGRQPTTKLTAKDIDDMPLDQFEKELEKFKNANP